LLAAVRARRSYLAIYQHYRQAAPKADFAALLDDLIDDTQDAIATLSHQVRLLDRSPVSAGVNEYLLTQGMHRRGTPSKLNFMLVGTKNTLEWVAAQRHPDDPPEIQELWQALQEMEQRHQDRVKEMLGQLHPIQDQQSPEHSS
jgi:rubrerythrin